MARLFEIVPTTALIRSGDGSVAHDDRVMYAIGEDAEQAFDSILQPYGVSGAWYAALLPSVKLAILNQRDKPAGSTLLDWVVAGVADRRVDGAEHATIFRR